MDYKEIVDKARAAQQAAQQSVWEKRMQKIKAEYLSKESSGEQANKQPDSQGQQVQAQNNSKPQGWSMADLKLKNFKEANGKLAKNKSQLPNLAVQARIFEPVTPGRRKFFKEWREISVVGRNDITIEHKFHQLDQADLTGWLMLIKYTGQDLISAFTYYEFIKAMGRKQDGNAYNWLLGPKDKRGNRKGGFLGRIRETQFSITIIGENKTTFSGSLAPHTITNENESEEDKNKFAVQLSKPLAAMFGLDHWSFVNIDQRLALGQKQWAQAFHAWCSTNTCPANGFWWRKEELWKQWGPEYKDLGSFMKDFRRRVLKPLYHIEFIKKAEEKNTAIGLWW